MSKIDREQLGEWLSAYVDGELNAEQEKLVERLLREDEGARRLLAELRRTVSVLSSLPRHRAPSSIATDVQLCIERSDLLGDADEAGVGPAGRRSPVFALLSMAAMLALVVGSFWMMWGDTVSPTGPPGDVVALAPDKASEEAEAGLRRVESLPARAKHDARSERRRGRGSKPSPIGRGEVAEQASAPGPPLPAGRRAEEKGLLATATLDQKMIAGLPLASLRAHRFDNEPVRLKVWVRSEAQRDAVTAKLIAYLAERKAAELADVPSNRADRPAPSGTYYHQGDPKVNFNATDQHQILVRASRRQLDGMMSELADAASTPDAVALVAGPLSIHGLEQARKALHGLDESTAGALAGRLSFTRDDDNASPPEALGGTGEARSDRPPARGDGVFGRLLRLVQLDPDTLAQVSEPMGDAESEESRAPTDEHVAALTVGEAMEPVVGGATAAVSDELVVKQSGQETYVADADLQDGDQEALAGAARRSSGKMAKARNGDQPPSLVDRRLKAIEESRRRRKPPAGAVIRLHRADLITENDVESPAAPTSHSYLAKPVAEHYITLVVQVIVAKPKPSPPARESKPSRKPPGKQRLETPRAE